MNHHHISSQSRESLPEQTKLVASGNQDNQPSPRVDPSQDNVTRGTLSQTIDLDERARNRALPQADVLAKVRLHPDILAAAQIVGRWLWVQFAAIPAPSTRATLAQLGFHWNNKRRVWQHPCGPISPDVSPDEPRSKYGAVPAA